MRKKKWITLLLTGIFLLSLVAGCGRESDKNTTDNKVSVAFWSDELTENYGPYLQKAFPDVDFEFYVITNSTDYYRFQAEKGKLPDILTVRRFSLGDVASFKDDLMDLSDSRAAGAFHQSYLRSYTYSDGTLNWLPVCAEVDGIIVNESLLADHNISLPTNYQEFTDACIALKKFGVRPFRSNFSADYTCMEILQGLSVQQLTSQEGREWRQQYESGQTSELSEEVWMPVFERMQEFIQYTGIDASDLETDVVDVYRAYQNQETAMMRGTSAEATRYGAADGSVMMPYFGDTPDNNWYLTYPAFQVAAKAQEEHGRKALICDILETMTEPEGLRYIATGEDMIAYTSEANFSLSPMMKHIRPYIDSNRLYIRLASADMFSVSSQVVQGMITGEYPDARSAFCAFNEAMKKRDKKPAAKVHIDTGYSYTFDPAKGSPAASAVMNSVREELGTQLLTGQSINVSGDIHAGDYTEEELRFLTMGESIDILLCEMTGAQMHDYLSYVLTASKKRGSVINDSSLYVSSGFEMEIHKTDTGYALDKLTIEGKELKPDEIYSAAILGNEVLMQKEALKSAGITKYTKSELAYEQIISDRLMNGRQLAAPTDYITLHL